MGIRIKNKSVALGIYLSLGLLPGLTIGCNQSKDGFSPEASSNSSNQEASPHSPNEEIDDDSSPVEDGIELGNPVTDDIQSDNSPSEEHGASGTMESENDPDAVYPQALISRLYVKYLILINADTGVAIRTLSNGAVIDLAKDGARLSIRALTYGGAESVAFDFDGKRKYIDNVSPFSLAGNSSGNYNPAQLTIGNHTLTATPFTSNYARGNWGSSYQISFSVVNSSSTTTPTPTPTPTSTPTPGGTTSSYRSDVVRVAKAEAALGLCGATARSKYVAGSGSAWCSEFARWVFIQASVMTDSTSKLWNITGWSQFRSFFTNKGKFLSRSQLTRAGSTNDLMTGNYLLLDTDGDGVPNHSSLIVGVSSDLASLYTVEGNVSNCTKSLTRRFWSGSTLDSKIVGIGVIW